MSQYQNMFSFEGKTTKLIGKKEYWWDGMHTTAKGSSVIADLIFPELYEFIR